MPSPAWRIPPRLITLAVCATFLTGGFITAVGIHLPYAVQRPGPTLDTLGALDGEELITISGIDTYPTDGELRLTTVSVVGGPGYPVRASDVLRAWTLEREFVLPVESVFNPEVSREELDEQASMQMTSSQTNATVSALESLGYEVPQTLTIAGAGPGTGAEGVVEAGDLLLSIAAPGQGLVEVEAFSDLSAVLRETVPGAVVTLGLEREGEAMDVEIVTGEGPHGALLGIYIDPEVEIPYVIDFDIEDIGGPSAGLMFSLAITDLLTEEDLAAGQHVAGTGTVDLAGQVGAIGGIVQKMHGSVRDGAEWFLAPAGNCADVLGNIPDGLEVVAVDTLTEAKEALLDVTAGRTDELPRCE